MEAGRNSVARRARGSACLTLALAGLLLAGPVSAQMTETEAAAEIERLDFKVGEWRVDAKIRNSPTSYLTGSGTMSIRWLEHGVLVADMNVVFEGFTVEGRTTRRFNRAAGRWDISWDPVTGEAVPDIEGRYRDDRFIEIDWGVDAQGPFIGRLVISDMTADHFSVRKDRIWDDGRVAPEIWVYEATRLPAGTDR